MKPRMAVVVGFLAMILLGAILLSLPISGAGGKALPFYDALFTAVSGACITGLTVIEPGVQLSRFGQIVLLILVQVGCVGIMTFGTFFLVVTGQRISLASEFALSDAYGTTGVKGLRGLIAWVIFSMLFLEGLGAAALWWDSARLLSDGVGAHLKDIDLWYRAFFYSAMAFSNAGFSLDPGSLAVFRTMPLSIFVLSLEIVLGGIGFLVLYNFLTIQFWRRNLLKRGHLSIHARVVLSATGIAILAAFIIFFLLEYRGAFAEFDGWRKPIVAFLHAVTPRTGGFTVVPMEAFQPATRFISGVLMFIGAAPGSAGGGIKVTTLVVFIATLSAIWHHRHETVVFKRTIREDVVRSALIIFFLYFLLVVLATTLLLMTEESNVAMTFERLMFEAVSAVTTTGLSLGDTTQQLSVLGRIIVMACMVIGRLGALGVVLMIAGSEESVVHLRYPTAELIVG